MGLSIMQLAREPDQTLRRTYKQPARRVPPKTPSRLGIPEIRAAMYLMADRLSKAKSRRVQKEAEDLRALAKATLRRRGEKARVSATRMSPELRREIWRLHLADTEQRQDQIAAQLNINQRAVYNTLNGQ